MALRDQPYIPLYIHDIMVDEKLNECCAATHGIYIKGLMCLMHKSEEYGKILLKQKYKQNSSMCLNFDYQLSKHLPYTIEEIEKAITELIQEGVCYFDGDYLCQKRMIRDNEISIARSKAGKKGGGNPNFVKTKIQTNNQTKLQTNYEYENEYENILLYPKDYKIILNNIQWIESVYKNKILAKNIKMSIDKFKELLNDFCSTQELNNKKYSSDNEYRNHFLNWIDIQAKKKDNQDKLKQLA